MHGEIVECLVIDYSGRSLLSLLKSHCVAIAFFIYMFLSALQLNYFHVHYLLFSISVLAMTALFYLFMIQ